MTKYFIYNIIYNNKPEIFYIGSTNNFIARKHKHKKNTTNKKGKLYWIKLYSFIRLNGGWDNFTINIISEHEFENKTEIRKIEQRIINERNPLLNSKNSYKE